MKKFALMVLAVLVLAGCADTQISDKKRNFRASAYTVADGERPAVFGAWQVVDHCRIMAKTADFSIETNGLLYGGALRFEVVFPAGVGWGPVAQITGKKGFLEIEQRGEGFRILLPYDVEDAMYLTDNGIYMSVSYRNTLDRALLENSIPLFGLASALRWKGENCR